MSPEVKCCRSCGAEVIWAITTNGKRMSVDALPREDGNIMLTEYPASAGQSSSASDGHIEAEYVNPTLFEEWDVPAPEPRQYASHFTTCPEAAHWRKA